MPNDSDGGLSREEFLVMQEQLLELRNKNYELQEELLKKNTLLLQQNTPKNEALQFASKLISRTSKKEKDEKDNEIDFLRRKLETQEEEFRLQQSMLFKEISLISEENKNLKSQVSSVNPDLTELKNEENNIIKELNENIKTLQNDLATETERANISEKLTTDLEDMMLIYQKRCEDSENEAVKSKKEIESISKILEEKNKELLDTKNDNDELQRHITSLNDDITECQLKYSDLSEKSSAMDCEVDEVKLINKMLEEENSALKNAKNDNDDEIQRSRNKITQLENSMRKMIEEAEESDTRKDKLIEELETVIKSREENIETELEYRLRSIESEYSLKIENLKKNFESERDTLTLKISLLEEKVKSQDEEKKLALKKQSALIKELQKSLKDEKKRADSYEKKSEEWHVVHESDGQSSHTYDGNDSISSLSAVESENVELITRLAVLQKLHSEDTDKILQLESENSRLHREVLEKGELIKTWIHEKPAPSQSQNSNPSPRLEGGLRKLLNNIGQDQSMQDLREMNKKLQRMLEETLSKNIILQRDLQTLLERSEL